MVPVNLCRQSAPAYVDQATDIQKKYEKLFKQFGACHCIYNSATVLTDTWITELGKQWPSSQKANVELYLLDMYIKSAEACWSFCLFQNTASHTS